MKQYSHLILLYVILIFSSCAGDKGEYQVSSPDGRIKLKVEVEKGNVFYTVTKDDNTILVPSALGYRLHNNIDLTANFEVVDVKHRSYNETWEQPWGERRLVENKYDEMSLDLRQKKTGYELQLIFRVFNDGIGFRYKIPSQKGLNECVILDEITEFNLPEVADAWWIPAYKEKFYESLYKLTPTDEMDTVCTPVTLQTHDGHFLVVHEANLTDYAAMNLFSRDGRSLSCDLTPWSTGEKVKATLPMQSPWRTMIIAETPGELISSNLMLNLNEPSEIDDTSWIKPGKYIGIWWGMHQKKYTWSQGPDHGATTKNVMRYIDFAAANSFDGVLVEGWNYGWDGDWTVNGDKFSFTKPYPDFDMEKISQYAGAKGVQLIGHHETGGASQNYESQMEEAFKYYREHGVHVVKTGYVSEKLDGKEFHSSQYGVRHYRKVIETAAKYQIMIDNHEPVMPSGLQRTFPNLMTQEGVRGQEWDAWSTDGGNPPEHTTVVPFTRGLAGPMDFTFGTFNFTNPVLPDTRVRTTLAKQAALYVIIYSPLQMASDLPENYIQNEVFDFIKKVPVNWEDSRVLDAVIGDYVVTARKDRDSEEWYCGAITDENGRKLEISLDFLTPAYTYEAQIISDEPKADWEKHPMLYEYKVKQVKSTDSLFIHLAPGGGQAIRFIPE
ncbi:MAG: glycoside hydrolase family 97 protein [Bacteroidales bacterium]|nr:glycoside hydrolase family 97 protein [Bacteroidales bacterium]